MHSHQRALPPEAPYDDDGGRSGRMSFLEHLDELRSRIIYSLAATLVGFLASLVASDRIFAFVMRPLHESLPAGGQLIYTDGPEVFVVYLQIGLLAGVLLASPVIMLQVWLFIAPGLYVHEKRLAIPFVLSATLCFVGGAAFSHYVSFPAASRFFASFSTGYVVFQPKVSSAMSLYLRMLFACALAFQLPTVTIFLARMRLITARWMLRNFKYATLVVFIVAAVVTPDSSPVSQVTLALPMLGLYVLSIGIAWLCSPRKATD